MFRREKRGQGFHLGPHRSVQPGGVYDAKKAPRVGGLVGVTTYAGKLPLLPVGRRVVVHNVDAAYQSVGRARRRGAGRPLIEQAFFMQA